MLTIIGSKGILRQIQSGEFFTDIPSITLYAEKVSQEGTVFHDVFIHFNPSKSSPRPQDEKVIFAKKGSLLKSQQDSLGPLHVKMRLINGHILKNYKWPWKLAKNELSLLKHIQIEKVVFQTYEFPLFQHQLTETLRTKDVMRSTPELWDVYWNHSSHLSSDTNRAKLELELWDRINAPLLCIVFSLLGFSLGIQKPRGKNSQSAILCFSSLVFYYALYFWLVALVKKTMIPAWVASFVPTTLLFFLATYFFRKQKWPG
jgi:lipopolysaccharide export LptBFGC system permease protein LptF